MVAAREWTRWTTAVGVGQPHLGEVLVLGHVDAVDHECHLLAVRRDRRARRLHDVADDLLGESGVLAQGWGWGWGCGWFG